MKVLSTLIVCNLYFISTLFAQNYTGIQGSMYAGSLGVGNNPASIVHTPYRWDINLASLQYKINTNAFISEKSTLLPRIDSLNYFFNNGDFKRQVDANFNLRVLNARIALNHRQTIAFGMNLRGYGNAATDRFRYIDTITTLHDLLGINLDLQRFSTKATIGTWMELFATYGMTVLDHDPGRLNAALTIKYNRNIAGGFAQVKNLGVESSPVGNSNEYFLLNGNARYGYADNLDIWANDKTSRNNIDALMDAAPITFAMDVGLEYVVKSGAITSIFEQDESYYEYEWKLGLALLDVGWNKFRFSDNSLEVFNVKQNISGNDLLSKFSGIQNIKGFNDSLSSIMIESNRPSGEFRILQPTRLVLNADRYIEGNIYVNGEVSLNLAGLQNENKYHLKEINFLTVTPRWETRKLGIYLPFQINNRGGFWVGTAFKAGPLFFGFHNIFNALGKNRKVKGGGYLAIVIRSGNGRKVSKDAFHECPIL